MLVMAFGLIAVDERAPALSGRNPFKLSYGLLHHKRNSEAAIKMRPVGRMTFKPQFPFLHAQVL